LNRDGVALNYLNRCKAALNLLNCRKASIRVQNYLKFFNFTKKYPIKNEEKTRNFQNKKRTPANAKT